MAPATSTAAAATPTGAIPPAPTAASAHTTFTSRDSTLTHALPPAATTRAQTLSRFRDRRPLTLSDVLLLRDAPPSPRPRAGCFGGATALGAPRPASDASGCTIKKPAAAARPLPRLSPAQEAREAVGLPPPCAVSALPPPSAGGDQSLSFPPTVMAAAGSGVFRPATPNTTGSSSSSLLPPAPSREPAPSLLLPSPALTPAPARTPQQASASSSRPDAGL
eukprot:scaffold20855_cov118-Isochrysis_galbana.AAC.2